MSYDPSHRYISAIQQTWNGTPTGEICLAILDYVLSPPKKEYLTLSMIRRAIGLNDIERQKELAAAIQYLLGDMAPVLSLAFEMIGEDDQPMRITSEGALLAKEHNINPLTGEVDPDIHHKIFAYFIPSADLGV